MMGAEKLNWELSKLKRGIIAYRKVISCLVVAGLGTQEISHHFQSFVINCLRHVLEAD